MSELQARPGRHLLRTSDDLRAVDLAPSGLRVETTPDDGLLLHGTTEVVDGYVLALASAGIAVRALGPASSALEDAFLELTT
jgi:hypothetical protein